MDFAALSKVTGMSMRRTCVNKNAMRDCIFHVHCICHSCYHSRLPSVWQEKRNIQNKQKS